MTQFVFLSKRLTSEPNRLEEFFNFRELKIKNPDNTVTSGKVFLSKVDLYVAHVDENVSQEFLKHLYSFPSYAPSKDGAYDENGKLVKIPKQKYGGFPWQSIRGKIDWFVKWFGGIIRMKPVSPPLQTSNLGAFMGMLGKRLPGQILMLGEIPDHKREGTEDL